MQFGNIQKNVLKLLICITDYFVRKTIWQLIQTQFKLCEKGVEITKTILRFTNKLLQIVFYKNVEQNRGKH